jgi:tRNA(His) guanylyltransferase
VNDPVGDRMKDYYESRTRTFLPRRTYTIIRCDGKNFSRYTKNFKKPFDEGFLADMEVAAIALCKEAQGCAFAYTQSDEISLLLTDFSMLRTDAWFDGNIQKIVSVAASTVAGAFISARLSRGEKLDELPAFDGRVFTISDRNEVVEYFKQRQADASRNSIQMFARSFFSHKELDGVSTSKAKTMLIEKGNPWEDLPARIKRGAVIREFPTPKEISLPDGSSKSIIRNIRAAEPAPFFSKNPEYLESLTPIIPAISNESANDTTTDNSKGD